MVSLKDMKMGIACILLMTYLVLVKSGEDGDTSLSRKQEEELKLLKKPAMKSIKTKYGDIYDCVDIKKQPAFDHPLLRNHSIQMKPSSFPKGMIDKELLASKPSKIGVNSSWCPPGTVLIQRIQKEDIIKSESQVRRYHGHTGQLITENPGYHFATFRLIRSDRNYYGGSVHLSIDQPVLYSVNQFSEAVLWVENGPIDQLNSIQVGWTANPKLFGDNRPRMFSYWTADGFHKTGCYNLLCPGFVQLSRKLSFGQTYDVISTYGGDQYEDNFLVYKDPKSGNWWYFKDLDGGHEPVGYWPSSLFTTLRDSASTIASGGQVYSPTNERSPQMGNGHFPIQNQRFSTAARRLQFVNERNVMVDPDAGSLKIEMDSPACYTVESVVPRAKVWINSIFYGGPGGACGI
ncbi:hypothetical protein NE237_033105 [Protea cynaroides]|uniref:Neprosin PEP catalytic domain-containing protein n=1 Tax=Protea cynaroides TaxID=273540 RepID=A0A9Q0L499_9MAGN|nr:hypothetical protein NE237_033105 [Protea cynaroides]